jgi:hypothetical protein
MPFDDRSIRFEIVNAWFAVRHDDDALAAEMPL